MSLLKKIPSIFCFSRQETSTGSLKLAFARLLRGWHCESPRADAIITAHGHEMALPAWAGTEFWIQKLVQLTHPAAHDVEDPDVMSSTRRSLQVGRPRAIVLPGGSAPIHKRRRLISIAACRCRSLWAC